MTSTTRKTAVELKDGDVVIFYGHRCRVSNFRLICESNSLFGRVTSANGPIARYTLTSEPNEKYPNRMLGGYEGGTYGGNELYTVCVEQN